MKTNSSEITEAQVVAFILARAEEIRATFGPDKYAVARFGVALYGCAPRISVTVSSGVFDTIYEGETFAEAMANAAKESPAVRAQKKRAEAARLLAEADELSPVAK